MVLSTRKKIFYLLLVIAIGFSIGGIWIPALAAIATITMGGVIIVGNTIASRRDASSEHTSQDPAPIPQLTIDIPQTPPPQIRRVPTIIISRRETQMPPEALPGPNTPPPAPTHARSMAMNGTDYRF